MAGILRWRDIQNINTTEDQINLLAGLTAIANDINRITGFLYTGSDLNNAVTNVATATSHISKDLSTAHPLLQNSLDGGVLADGTISLDKLNFSVITGNDYDVLTNQILNNDIDIENLQNEINNLYSIILPGQAQDIADSINQMIEHVEKTKDAHDGTAISFGNQYEALLSTAAGSSQTRLSLDDIRFFQEGDVISLQDTLNGPEDNVVSIVNYNTGHLGFETPTTNAYSIENSYIIHLRSQDNIQEAIHRSLRNTTDVFTGRLTINQDSNNNALDINQTGTGYTAKFNDFTSKTDDSFNIELGAHDGSTRFRVANDEGIHALDLLDNGQLVIGNVALSDYNTLNFGQITKQVLTEDQEWVIPNRSGYIGLGDTTFSELLKVSLVDETKEVSITPGYSLDYKGETVSAWIDMENPCRYEGGNINLEAKMSADGELLALESQYQVITIFINDSDLIGFFYGPKEATREEAIDNYENYIPSAYMKLAKILVQGNGTGGIDQTSIEILEDQRPFLSMGMSAACYDESLILTTGGSPGDIISLPVNSRGGGSIITYRIGKSQLEVYLDGVYQRAGIDYEEYQGEPAGQIRLLKEIKTNSQLRFRITFKAAAVTGGIEVETLQSVYQNGPTIGLSALYGPIQMFGFDVDTVLNIDGNVIIEGLIRAVDALEFDPQSIMPGETNTNKVYVDTNSSLIFHQYKSGVATDIDLLEEIENAQSSVIVKVNNMTGSTIPADRGVALHSSLTNHVVLCDTSNALSSSRLFGVTMDNIPSPGTGRVVISGVKESTSLSFSHGTVIAIDPRNPGLLVNKDSIIYLPEDQRMEVGQMNGSSLVVDIDRTQKNNEIWRTAVAGEDFLANETKLVRWAVAGEDRGRVYKADNTYANVNEKFWVIAAVKPLVDVLAGETINLYKDIELSSAETAFVDTLLGKPIYLGKEGNFASWNSIVGTYSVGDAIIKVGMIEDRRKISLDGGLQMMGTAGE